MAEQKYHIGKNGPAPCRANPDRAGGRSCRFGGSELHGSREEVTAIWEQQLLAESPDYLSGFRGDSQGDPRIAETIVELDDLRLYSHGSMLREEEIAIARELARTSVSELSYASIAHSLKVDAESASSVSREVFEDGSAAYFKSYQENATDEDLFSDYGTTALGAAINEVNAHRMAEILGGDFSELVPQTSMRAMDGSIGTIQAEVERADFEDDDAEVNLDDAAIFSEDIRRAALFDFVIGSMDRHHANFIPRKEEIDGRSRRRISLIDNSFSFPSAPGEGFLNESRFNSEFYFGNSFRNRRLREEEVDALLRARIGVDEWIERGTIAEDRGRATLKRIDYLLENGAIDDFEKYHAPETIEG